jgi:hypothetical protein
MIVLRRRNINPPKPKRKRQTTHEMNGAARTVQSRVIHQAIGITLF